MKYLMLAGLCFATLLFEIANTTEVEAARYCPNGGYCAPGTCTKFRPAQRVQHACKASNWSAANCRN